MGRVAGVDVCRCQGGLGLVNLEMEGVVWSWNFRDPARQMERPLSINGSARPNFRPSYGAPTGDATAGS